MRHSAKFILTAVTTRVGDITEAVQPTVSTATRVEPQEAVPTTVSFVKYQLCLKLLLYVLIMSLLSNRSIK